MKSGKIFLAILVMIHSKALTQVNECLLKTYGYSRAFISGVAPVNAIEIGGKEVLSEARNNREYYIYLKTCNTSSVTVTAVWINGTSYSAKAFKRKSPVILSNTTLSSKGMNETLVGKTSLALWELRLSPDNTILRPIAGTQKMIKANSMVIEGFLKGKKFASTLKTFKELQPLAAQ